tara:strand:- start:20920 stop:22701 length:1782 start_codon:yes stop_codon:yes gene_type:complete
MNIKSQFKALIQPLILLLKLINKTSQKNKRKLLILNTLIIISGFTELLSLASILPVLTLYSNPNFIRESPYFITLSKITNIYDSTQILLLTTLIFILVVIFSTSIKLYSYKEGAKIGALIGNDLSTRGFQNNIIQPYITHTTKNSGEIINLLAVELQTALNAINIGLRFSSALATFIFIFIGIFFINFYTALACIISFGSIYIFIAKKSSRQIEKNSLIKFKSNNILVKQVQDVFQGIREVILDNKQLFYISNYEKIDYQKRKAEAIIDFTSVYPYYLLEGFAFILFTILGLFISLVFSNQDYVLTYLGSTAIALQKLLRSMQQIYFTLSVLRGSNESLKSVLRTLDIDGNKKFINRNSLNLGFKKNIILRNVSFSYSRNLPLTINNLNLKIEKGEVVGIIGETGSGKSTLLDLIMGLLEPTEGKIMIDGIDINVKDNNIKERWFNSICHVSQSIFLKDASIFENIALGETISELNFDKVVTSAKAAKIKSFIDSLPEGFNTNIGESGIKLSGGQKQRIAIARAIYKKSKLLVLDEATSALDNKIEKEVMDSLNSLDKNITVIMVAHRLSSLSNCNRIIQVKDGKVYEEKDLI